MQAFHQGDILNDGIYLVAIIEDRTKLLLKDEVDFYDRFIVCPSECSNGISFPDLPGPFHNKRLSIGILLPISEVSIYLSFKQFHGLNHIFGIKNKQKITFSEQFFARKSHFRHLFSRKNHIFGTFFRGKITFSLILGRVSIICAPFKLFIVEENLLNLCSVKYQRQIIAQAFLNKEWRT